MRVADFIAETLRDHGIEHVFMLTGGGAMHLNDAFGRCKGLKYICLHHEQACAQNDKNLQNGDHGLASQWFAPCVVPAQCSHCSALGREILESEA